MRGYHGNRYEREKAMASSAYHLTLGGHYGNCKNKSDIVKDRTGFPTGSFLPSDDKALENHL